MKYLSLLLALVAFQLSQAAVLVVDNTPGAGAPYSTVSAAISAATNGDTVMIQPSVTSYGQVDLGKRLVLIGPGYYPEDRNVAKIEYLRFTSSNASNSILTGLQISRIQTTNNNVNGITLQRNYLFGRTIIQMSYPSSGWLIEGNLIDESAAGGGYAVIQLHNNSSNFTFRNNIIYTRASSSNNTRMFNNLNGTTSVIHNIIIHRNPGYLFGGITWGNANNDVLLQNNIIWVTNPAVNFQGGCNNCIWNHNLTFSAGNTLPVLPGTANIDNTDPQFLQIPNVNNPAFAFDNDYRCAPGSPGATGASDGGMLGVHGGNYPFRNYLEPAGIPRMLDLILDNVILEVGNNASVRVKAVGGAE